MKNQSLLVLVAGAALLVAASSANARNAGAVGAAPGGASSSSSSSSAGSSGGGGPVHVEDMVVSADRDPPRFRYAHIRLHRGPRCGQPSIDRDLFGEDGDLIAQSCVVRAYE